MHPSTDENKTLPTVQLPELDERQTASQRIYRYGSTDVIALALIAVGLPVLGFYVMIGVPMMLGGALILLISFLRFRFSRANRLENSDYEEK